LPPEQNYFIGEELDESELGRRRQAYPWETIVNAVDPGKAREVSMAYQTVRRALADLVKRGKIKKDEYYVRTIGAKDKENRHVYLVHRGKKTA
jgi:hypothetical protein